MMPKVIGIVGSRRRNTANNMVELLVAFDRIFVPGDSIVSGGCPKGADNFAEHIAKARGIPIVIHHPDWSKGRWAGLARNTLIAEDCDVLLAMPSATRTGGTEDTIKKAEQLGKEIILC